MRRSFSLLWVGLLVSPMAQGALVQVDNSTGPWNAFMNVFELPSNGGAYVFGSGWGIADLNATFNDGSNKLTLSPNTIGDPNPFWYTPAGGPGAAGNKIMEANLYQESTGPLAGQTVTFEGTVLSNTFTSAHQTYIFIRDFAPDYSGFVESAVLATPGNFSISLNTINDPARHVQYGFRTSGVNVWATDVEPFGNVMIATVPEPATLALIAMGGFAMLRRRRA